MGKKKNNATDTSVVVFEEKWDIIRRKHLM